MRSEGNVRWVAWLPLLAGVFLVPEAFYHPPSGLEWQIVQSPLVGLVIGTLWQVLSPRDLVDRLTIPAVLILLAMVAWVILPNAAVSVGLLLYGAALTAALVLTERLMRRRTRRRQA